MFIIFKNRFFASKFLSVILIFVSALNGNGQIKPPESNQLKSSFQFWQSKTDSSNNRVIFARLPGKELSVNPLQKTSGILATCNTSTFYMHLTGAPGQKINLRGLQTLPDGNFIVTGNTFFASTAQEGMLCILTNSGSLVSQRQLRINNNPVTLFTTIVLLDGKLVIAGILNDGSNKAFVSLLNADLSTNWVQVFNLPSSPSKITISLTESNQFTFAVQLSGSVIFSLLNMNGSVVWYKEAFPAGLDELIGFNEPVYN